MNCVIYVRWSSTEQGRGSSRERQLEDCRRHAEAQGWPVVEEIFDEGVSAFKGRHATEGALARFVEKVEVGGYPAGVVLLTEKLDRLSRQEPGRVFSWMIRVTDAGVVVATVDGSRRYERGKFDMAGIIEVVVKAQLAHEESQKKADRVAAAWRVKRDRVASGERIVMTKRAPAWLRVEGSPRAFVLIPERAAIVRRIFEETVAGRGKVTIARGLNADGVPVFGRASGWHASYVAKILGSPTVLGEMQPGRKPRGARREAVGDPIVGYYPAVVDADLHARTMRAMGSRARQVGGRGRRLVNLWGGLARCDACGSRMTYRGKGEATRASGAVVSEDYLLCDSVQRGLGCTSRLHFHYGAWERAILEGVLTQAMGDEHFASQHEVAAAEAELAATIRRRDAADRKAGTAMALFIESERPEVKEAWSTLSAERDTLDAQAADLRKRIVTARGAVTPVEHQARIAGVFDQLADDDEAVRHEARSRVMDAVHSLIATMSFSAEPPMVRMTTKAGAEMEIEHIDGKGMASEFFYRIGKDFYD